MLTAATCAVVALGCWEALRLARHRANVPIRIHVNGTRGKSSVTRLIAAGLRAGGLRTCAKTTGTLARFIHPDGSEEPVERIGRANVIEQVSVMKAAAECSAEAIVLECMAVNPLLQSLCELKIVHATHGVITNARPDHLDVMGPTPDDVARALAGTVPAEAVLFTAERERLAILKGAAADRGSNVVAVGDDHVAAVTWDEMNRFAHIEHPDNVALALEVCASLGIDRGTALQGMWEAIPDPGVMAQYEIAETKTAERGGRAVFINAFAANDPESTDNNWRMAAEQCDFAEKRIVVVNCRADRPDRSEQMAELCASWEDLDRCIVVGTGVDVFQTRALSAGMSSMKMMILAGYPLADVVEEIDLLAGRSAMVMGIGNIADIGMDLVTTYRDRHLNREELLPAAESQDAFEPRYDELTSPRQLQEAA